MVSVLPDFNTAVVNALRGSAALTTLGIDANRDVSMRPSQGQALPYLVVTGPTEAEASKSTTSTTSTITMSITAWSTTYTNALALAAKAAEVLADRTAPLSVSGFSLLAPTVDLVGPPFADESAESTAPPWGCPARVRYIVMRDV